MKITSEQVVGEHIIAGRHILVQRVTWSSTSGLSFDLIDAASHKVLTEDEAFDDYPTDEQMRTVLERAGEASECPVGGRAEIVLTDAQSNGELSDTIVATYAHCGIEIVEGRHALTLAPTWAWTHPEHGDRFRLVYTMGDRLYLYLGRRAGRGGPEWTWTGDPGGIPCGSSEEEARAAAHAAILRIAGVHRQERP